VVHPVHRRLRHAPGPARRAKAAPSAAEGDQLVVAAVAAVQAQEAVGQDAALEEVVELVFDKLRQVCAGSVGITLCRASKGARDGLVATPNPSGPTYPPPPSQEQKARVRRPP
jgi:hypothetical protein